MDNCCADTLAERVKKVAQQVNSFLHVRPISCSATSNEDHHHAVLPDLRFITFRACGLWLERRVVSLNVGDPKRHRLPSPIFDQMETIMKAVIICSVHALCNISQFEREACNRACALHGIPAHLTAKDHARLLSATTMLGFLNHLPGSEEQRQGLIASYLDILNDQVWEAALTPYKSVSSSCFGLKNHTKPKGFVSDYPLLTTNVVRSAALLTNASKLGHLTALSDPLEVKATTAALASCATSIGVAHHEIEVLVAHKRDFVAAKSLGMHPSYIEGLRPDREMRMQSSAPRLPVVPMTNSIDGPQPIWSLV